MSATRLCPVCKRKVDVPDDLIDRDVFCLACGARLNKRLDSWGTGSVFRRDLEPHRGDFVLTLGILSMVIGFACIFFPLVGTIMGALAWSMGNRDLIGIKAGIIDPDGESATRWGRNCGRFAANLFGVCLLLQIIVLGIHFLT